MKRIRNIVCALIATATIVSAQNPIIQTVFTADPAPLVHNDTLYLFTGHDEDSATQKGFVMKDYLCFSTTDMVNWTHHGPVFSTESLGWAAPLNANAAQVEFRNGKFYYYISPWSALPDGGDCIAVGVADSPYGPYKDAIGKPLISNGQTKYSKHPWEDIDPTILIDDDGQAYMYWGNNSLYCVKLNEDMISYSGDIITFDIKDKAAFGSDYEEAPWVFKRNDIYYMMYAAHIPEAIYYATSSTPLGPWKYGGVIMKAGAQGCNGNHPGVIQYKGNWYLFYFNQDLPGGHDKRRAVNVIPFDFNPDGSITELAHSKAGVNAVANLNPYKRTEAETIAWTEGVETAKDEKMGVYVTDISNGDYIKVRSVDFANGAKKFDASTVAIADGGNIEIRIDSIDGALLGNCPVEKSGSIQNWELQSSKVKKVEGVHDVYFVFKGGEGDLFNFDWWRFSKN
ncbi:MAG: glycoside hydrolase family 43 protein [Prolixibacteraceae bacterium]